MVKCGLVTKTNRSWCRFRAVIVEVSPISVRVRLVSWPGPVRHRGGGVECESSVEAGQQMPYELRRWPGAPVKAGHAVMSRRAGRTVRSRDSVEGWTDRGPGLPRPLRGLASSAAEAGRRGEDLSRSGSWPVQPGGWRGRRALRRAAVRATRGISSGTVRADRVWRAGVIPTWRAALVLMARSVRATQVVSLIAVPLRAAAP